MSTLQQRVSEFPDETRPARGGQLYSQDSSDCQVLKIINKDDSNTILVNVATQLSVQHQKEKKTLKVNGSRAAKYSGHICSRSPQIEGIWIEVQLIYTCCFR